MVGAVHEITHPEGWLQTRQCNSDIGSNEQSRRKGASKALMRCLGRIQDVIIHTRAGETER